MTLREVLLKTLTRRETRVALRGKRGVTLVEVLIVVAIMALIAGGVGFLVLPRYRESQVKTAQTQARAIRGVATQYVALKGNGDCPTVPLLISEKELDPENEKDPWGQVFALVCDADDIQVSSPGPDKQEGTEDDIVVPELSAPAEG